MKCDVFAEKISRAEAQLEELVRAELSSKVSDVKSAVDNIEKVFDSALATLKSKFESEEAARCEGEKLINIQLAEL
jgi:hypothetical protein